MPSDTHNLTFHSLIALIKDYSRRGLTDKPLRFETVDNASVNSSSAHPPPRANPRALEFFSKN